MNASTLTDKQVINEMLESFIVPQWYTREHIVEKCEDFTEDQVDEVIVRIKDGAWVDVDFYFDACIDGLKEKEKEIVNVFS